MPGVAVRWVTMGETRGERVMQDSLRLKQAIMPPPVVSDRCSLDLELNPHEFIGVSSFEQASVEADAFLLL